jgi:type IV pilus assembly protein PilO
MAFKITLPSRNKRSKKRVSAREPRIDIIKHWFDLLAQFRGADWRNPAALPVAPKFLLCVLVAGVGLLLVWLALVRGQLSLLETKQQEEEKLKKDFIEKTTKVANLGPLLQQRHQAEEYVAQLEKQLPGKSEMANLLSDINQAGVGRNLQFELFKPGNEEVKAYYAQLPVSIRISGRFPDIAAFAADIAHLSRIVTLGNMNIGARKDGKDPGNLIMEATANTFRYLDKSEKLVNAKNTQSAGKKSPVSQGAKS